MKNYFEKLKKEYDIKDLIRFLVVLVVYMIFCFTAGVQICADSKGYINMISAREPVYPLFLFVFRSLFGENIYLNIVIVIQNLLMTFGVWWSVTWLKKNHSLNELVAYIMIFVHFGVAFLCQFAAGRSSIYPNSILTEGITTSLWLVFMTLLWKAIKEKTVVSTICPLLLSALMMDTRKQMAVAYIVLAGSVFLLWMKSKGYIKKLAIVAGLSVLSVLLAICGTRLYNLALRGEFAQNTRDMNLVLTTSLYIADKEDALLIDEPEVRELFLETYDILDELECNYKYAGKGWRNLESHYTEHYDLITVETTGPLFIEYAEKLGFAKGMEAEKEADRMSSVIVSSLLKDNIITYARVYLASMGNGLINTVAKRHRILDWYALLAYLGYIAVLVVSLVKKETREAGAIGLSVLVAIFVNVGVTAALIFCQTRYMIYNMALFYVAGILMAYGLIKSFVIKKKPDQDK